MVGTKGEVKYKTKEGDEIKFCWKVPFTGKNEFSSSCEAESLVLDHYSRKGFEAEVLFALSG